MTRKKTPKAPQKDIPGLLRMIGLSYRKIAQGLRPPKSPTTVSAYFNEEPWCGPETGKQIQAMVNGHKATAIERLKALDR
jgi:hypothetical protein